MNVMHAAGLLAVLFGAQGGARPFGPVMPPPGSYTTSWVGNTFGGSGGENGFGYWVQNGADEIEVAPDGTVLAGVEWDEAGRCAGLYRDGRVNRVLLRGGGGGPETAWGWNTGNNALAVWGERIYIANTGKRLLRFAWTPGDLDSGCYLDEAPMSEKAVGLAVRDEMLVAVYPDALEVWDARALKPARRIEVTGASDAAIAADHSLWVLSGTHVRHLSAEGRDLGAELPGLQKPASVSVDPAGRVIVADDGPRQQVLIFDVSGAPRLVQAFGQEGGLLSGVSGEVAPLKLFALRGAGADAQGNLYVVMSFGNGPAGNLFLRSFTPAGKLRWEVMSTAFVDTFGFDPDADGSTLFSRTAVFDLDLGKSTPGSEWRLRAVTLDPLHQPDDPRLKYGGTMLVRRPGGRPVLYSIGQYAGGYRIYVTGEHDYTAHQEDQVGPRKGEGEQWAWDVDRGGSVWNGDAPGKTIRRYPFLGWDAGKPRYDWEHPQSWPWPEGWDTVRRVIYDDATDTLYLSGYLKGERIETWGVVGAMLRRYDGWVKGRKGLAWSVATPRDGNTDQKEGPLCPSSVCMAGDYLFFGMVKPTNNKEYVHIYRTADGGYAGSFQPGPAVIDHEPGVGWLDMPYSTQALRRRNGEYLILVEEDWRGKNLLYRWKPAP